MLVIGLTLPLTMSAKTAKLRDIYGPESLLSLPETQTLVEKAEDAFYQAEYAVAFDALQRAVKITEEKLGTNNRDMVNLLTLMGEGQTLLGDYLEADRALTRANQIAEAVIPDNHPLTGRMLIGLAGTRLGLGNPAEATQLAERGVSILGTHYGSNAVAYAFGLQTKAMLMMLSGENHGAEKLVLRSRALLEDRLGSDNYYVGLSLWASACVAQQLARFEETISLCEHARKTLLQTVSSNHMTVVLLNSTLADSYRQLAKWDKARELLTKNLLILERAFGRDSLFAAVALNSLGLVELAEGNFSEAEAAFRRSLVARERYLGTNSVGYAATLNNLALSLRAAGRSEDVIVKLYEKATKTIEAGAGKDSSELATILVNWSDISAGMGKTAKAAELMARALAINRKAFGEVHPAVARCLAGSASLLANEGRCAEALRLADQALSVRRTYCGGDHPDIADNLYVVAEILARMECYSLSAENFRESAQMSLRCGLDPSVVAYGFERTSDVQAAAGKFPEALLHSFYAVRAKQQSMLRRFATTADSDALSDIHFGHFQAGKLHTLCRTCQEINPGHAALAGAIASAFGKGLLEEVRTTQSALEADPSTETRGLLLKHQYILAGLDSLKDSPLTTIERDNRRQELQALLQETEAELSVRVRAMQEQIRTRDTSFLDVAQSIPPNAVLLNFAHYFRFDFAAKSNEWNEAHYAAYMTFPLEPAATNPVVVCIDLGEAAQINSYVELVRKRLSVGQFAEKSVPFFLSKVSALLYAPLAPYLTNVTHLIICPDEQLSWLPFEMLPVGNKFLVEEKTISYVTSGREVVRIASPNSKVQSPESSAEGRKSLVMGNPDFDLDLTIAQASQPRRRSLNRSHTGMKFLPLPGSGVEATNVARLLGADATLKLGPEAREAELKAVQSPRVLHLATHGFFLSDQEFKQSNALRDFWMGAMGTRWNASLPKEEWENPLVRCGIALAGANHARQITNAVAEDGLLTGLEAALLNLQGTELVILSACDSGTGEVKIGEGVMSLRRAFRIAGAETVLASHWKVSDRATSRLMTEFVRRWRSGEPRAKAWREAQLELLRTKGAREDFSNPYFWAAFTVTGQWN